MNKKAILILFTCFILFSSCRSKSLHFEKESWFFYRLPVNADAYFKFNLTRISKINNLHALARVKEIAAFFKEYGIDFLLEAEEIYGALFFSESKRNVFILKGRFQPDKIRKAVTGTHISSGGEINSFHKSRNGEKWNLGLYGNDRILFTQGGEAVIENDKSSLIFHTLNIFKRVDFNAHGWFLLAITQNVQNYLKNSIELELLGAASYYSFSYNLSPESNVLHLRVQIYVKRKELLNKIIRTIFSYYEKMSNTYLVIKKNFSSFRVYEKGNFARIDISVNLDGIKI